MLDVKMTDLTWKCYNEIVKKIDDDEQTMEDWWIYFEFSTLQAK